METRPHNRRAASSPTHLPPLELIPNITIVNKKYRITEKIDTPTDDFNVPHPIAVLQRLGQTMIYDENYAKLIDTSICNVHHHAYTKKKYTAFGDRSFQSEYREGSSLKTEMYIPFHNLEHLMGIEPPVPDNDVMKERAREQKTARQLYKMARAVLWLDSVSGSGQSTYRTAETYLEKHHLPDDSYTYLPSYTTFLRTLEGIQPGTMGIMPDIEQLALLDLDKAVEQLAKAVASDVVMDADESTRIILEASRLSGEKRVTT